MNRVMAGVGRVAMVFCAVTTLALAIFVAALWSGGLLTSERLDAAVRGMRGEPPVTQEPRPATTALRGPTPGDVREMETLVSMAEARERELREQADKARSERRAADKASEEKKTSGPGPATPVAGTRPAEPVASAKFQSNVDILRNHTPKTAATMMVDWATPEIVAYLRAMKPLEAADILEAMLKLGKVHDTDCQKKAIEVQAALGK